MSVTQNKRRLAALAAAARKTGHFEAAEIYAAAWHRLNGSAAR